MTEALRCIYNGPLPSPPPPPDLTATRDLIARYACEHLAVLHEIPTAERYRSLLEDTLVRTGTAGLLTVDPEEVADAFRNAKRVQDRWKAGPIVGILDGFREWVASH